MNNLLFIIIPFMSFPFILMRHADSEHNKMKREIKNKFNVEKVKQLP